MKYFNTYVAIFVLSFPSVALAQTESADSIAGQVTDVNKFRQDGMDESAMLHDNITQVGTTYGGNLWKYAAVGSPVFAVNQSATALPPMRYVPGQATMFSWERGGVFATGSREALHGLMGIESASVGISQRIGGFSVAVYASAAKYGYFRGLSASYGFGGAMSYDFNEQLSMTLFGSYASTPAGMGQAAMLGYVSLPVFGGYINWKASEHWGVKVGAQSYRTSPNGRWEAQPIVMPYYRTSGGAELGIDVGGILYQVVRQTTGGSWGNQGNPTIGRPDFGPPPVAPRR